MSTDSETEALTAPEGTPPEPALDADASHENTMRIVRPAVSQAGSNDREDEVNRHADPVELDTVHRAGVRREKGPRDEMVHPPDGLGKGPQVLPEVPAPAVG